MKKTLLVLCCFLPIQIMLSQSFIGYDTDNFNGIHGVLVNPANIADARIQMDVNLVSAGGVLANDYTGLTLSNITDLISGNLEGINMLSNAQNSVLANAEIVGPAFMLNLNEKHGIGFISKVRIANTFNNVDGELLDGLIDGFPTSDFDFEQNNLDATTHIWGEIGASYGRVLFYDYDQHYLKGGITLKYLMGAGIAQGTSENLTGSFSANSNQIGLTGDFSYLISYDNDQNTSDYLQDLSPGFGMDLGVVYEFRTRESRFADADDHFRALNTYRAKIGVSVLDVGAITYKDVQLTNYDVNGSVNADEAEEDFIDALENNFASDSITGDVTVALPTRLRINIDYKIIPKVYANVDINQTLVQEDSPYNNNGLNRITFTPRFETRFFSAYLPVTYSALGRASIGAGFKCGPAFIGSGSIISNVVSDTAQTVNMYFGFKVPIKHKR